MGRQAHSWTEEPQVGTWAVGSGHRPPDSDLYPHPTAMEVWCRSRIPVEGNFGQTYDSVNQSIHDLGGEFSATIDLKVGGRGWDERGSGWRAQGMARADEEMKG